MMADYSEKVLDAWKSFKNNANWTGLHPLDQDRFYKFLWIAHQDGHALDEDFIESFLPKNLSEAMHDRMIRTTETAGGLLDVVTGKGSRG